MLRWMMPLMLAVFAVGPATAADRIGVKHGTYRAASQLPAGLPRLHSRYRTTIAPTAAPYGRRVDVEDEPEVLFTPSNSIVPYVPPIVGTPLLLGSSTLPGNYGRAFSYDYQGPYYGGRYVGYWNRLPYACGVYGYC